MKTTIDTDEVLKDIGHVLPYEKATQISVGASADVDGEYLSIAINDPALITNEIRTALDEILSPKNIRYKIKEQKPVVPQ